jgi:hypothetical protein
VPDEEEAEAGRREALEPDLEPAKGKKLSAKGKLSKVTKAMISLPLAACVLLSTLAVAPSDAWASENVNWGKGVELTAPANAAEDPEVFLRKVSCPSAGNCTAAGSYDVPPEHKEEPPRERGELLSETGGRWERGVEVTMPAGAATDPKVEFTALSCPSVGNCTAAGEYRDNAGDEQGFLLTETAGTWGSVVEAPLPANASSKPEVRLGQISCPSAGNCTVVGDYNDGSGQRQGFLASETAGTWEAALKPYLPANAVSNPNDRVTAVSCASAGNCTAVGSYEDGSEKEQGFLWTETAGTWGPGVEATLPANAGSSSELRAISCPSEESCTAVGEYTDSSNDTEGLMLSENAGRWGTAVEARMPANARSEPDANVHEVQCPSAGNCTAFGDYIAFNSEEVDGVFLTETAGVWGAGVKRPLPADAEPQLVIGGSLSCPSAGDCSYVGDYKVDDGFVTRAVLVTENDGMWGPGIDAALPANATGDPGAFLSSVSCTSPGSCTAVGSYNSYTGASVVERQGMVFTATPATAILSASGPLGGAFAGSPISASAISATLAGGSAPSGPITFTVFGPRPSPPSSCTSGGTTVAAASAYGDGTYNPSTDFTPTSPGEYWWYASYGGDAGDEPAVSTCGPGMAETAVVPKATPTLSTSATMMDAVAGSPIPASSISATLAEGTAPTGTITFTVFGPQSSPPSSCASGGTAVGTANVNGNGPYQPSLGFTPPSAGEYWWYASYGGAAGDEPAASACGPLMAQVLVAAAPMTVSSPGSGSSPVSGSGAGTGTAARPPATTLSRLEIDSKHLTAKKVITLKLTSSQAATIEVLIAETVTGHKLRGVCKHTAKTGGRCTTTAKRRTVTFSGSPGSNTFKIKLAGLGKGRYTATITAENANGESTPIKLTFTIADR